MMFNLGDKSYKLVSKSAPPLVTYSVTLHTFKQPQSMTSGVNICILGGNRALLHRIAPYPIIDKGRPHTNTFEACDVGEVEGILIAPENGSLALEEVGVSIHEKEQMVRFLYGEEIGGRHNSDGAAYLKPLLKITPEKKAEYDFQYLDLKNKLNFGTLQLAILGTFVTGGALGLSKALAFSFGTLLSMSYFQMLQFEVDNIGNTSQFVTTTTRLATLFGVAGFIVAQYHDQIVADNSYFIIGFLGFLTYKISIMRLTLKK